jgi:hypothetical protein
MMAKKTNGNTHEPVEEPQQPEIGRDNCTDETRRDFWRRCLLSKIAHESSVAAAKVKLAEHRNNLKDAKKAGVDSQAIAYALNARFADEDVLVVELRERLKMLDLAGVVPGIVDKILARLDVQEPTRNEREQITLDRAYDGGVHDGTDGKPRDGNPYPAGSDAYDAHDRGWLTGQRAIANEMAPQPPATVQ